MVWLHEAIINTEMRLDGIRLNFNDSFVANWCSHSSRKKKTWETNRRKEIGQEIRTKANEVKQGKAVHKLTYTFVDFSHHQSMDI